MLQKIKQIRVLASCYGWTCILHDRNMYPKLGIPPKIGSCNCEEAKRKWRGETEEKGTNERYFGVTKWL